MLDLARCSEDELVWTRSEREFHWVRPHLHYMPGQDHHDRQGCLDGSEYRFLHSEQEPANIYDQPCGYCLCGSEGSECRFLHANCEVAQSFNQPFRYHCRPQGCLKGSEFSF